MKSSAISLLHESDASRAADGHAQHAINLLDSPGHVDFCSEVSTAARLSDGCIVLVDVCEGVCVQTHAVLRQAWEEGLEPVLVLNKMDRLITELRLSPQEAYNRLRTLLSEVNGIISQFRSERFISRSEGFANSSTFSQEQTGDEDSKDGICSDYHDCDLDGDEEDQFRPTFGNVAFSSAYDGWCFTVQQVAKTHAAKFECKADKLAKAMWGDWFFHPKQKKIVGKKAAAGKLKQLFVQLALEPIWQLYLTAEAEANGGTYGSRSLAEMAKGLRLNLSSKELEQSDRHSALQEILKSWIPAHDALLGMAVDHLPSPRQATSMRFDKLVPKQALHRELSDEAVTTLRRLENAQRECDAHSEHTTIYISKLIAVPASALPGATDVEAERFLAIGRVFSGTLRPHSRMHVLTALYDPSTAEDSEHRRKVDIGEIYLMMGRRLTQLDHCSAGGVVAIAGLDTAILKTATLSSTPYCRPFASMFYQAAPIVRVAVEPQRVDELPKLMDGLRLLHRADPFVEVSVEESGENVVAAAGEVHLESCLKDLRERFAGIEIQVSAPLVAFKETVTSNALTDAPLEECPWATAADDQLTLRVRTKPLSRLLTRVINDNSELVRHVVESSSTSESTPLGRAEESIKQLVSLIQKAYESSAGAEDTEAFAGMHALRNAWALGPKRTGPNILLASDSKRSDGHPMVEAEVAKLLGLSSSDSADGNSQALPSGLWDTITGGILTGFQVAAQQGPLCHEPLWGIAIQVECEVHDEEHAASDLASLSGQVIAATKEAIDNAILASSPRLVEAQFLCVISVASEAVGKAYRVLGKRRSKVLNEEMKEGTGLFIISALLPVAASFGFLDDLRKSTSGAASAQLVLSHWETLDVDPFYLPKTQEEREELGEAGEARPNLARELRDQIRKRKGLYVEEKHVEDATKQRNLSKKV